MFRKIPSYNIIIISTGIEKQTARVPRVSVIFRAKRNRETFQTRTFISALRFPRVVLPVRRGGKIDSTL